MRESEFWMLMDDEFGEAYAGMVARTQQLGSVSGLTAEQALQAGIPARAVWEALCEHMSIPEERRLGRDRPLRRGAIED